MNTSYKYFPTFVIIIIGIFFVQAIIACPSAPPPDHRGCDAGCCGDCCGEGDGATTGDPVFIKKGEFVHNATDFTIQGRRFNVEIKRRYGSRRNTVSPFGYGWDFNYNMRIYYANMDYHGGGGGSSGSGGTAPPLPPPPAKVQFFDGTGSSYYYYLSDYKYIRNDNSPQYFLISWWSWVSADVLIKPDNTTYEFDRWNQGRLWQIRDHFFNNTITINYKPNGQIDTITDDLGRNIYFTYNSSGNIETITDFAGRQWEYVYDESSGDLTEVLGPASEANPDGLIEAYSYDGNHNLISVKDANGDEIMHNYYNADDQVYRQDIDGASYVFDNNDANGVMTTTDREGNIIKQGYNQYGQLTSRTVYTQNPADEPNRFATAYSYNSVGRRNRITYPAGNCLDFTYDSYGNLSGEYLKKQPGDLQSRDDNDVLATTYTYDTLWKNKVKTVTDPIGNITTYDYNSYNGNLVKITYPTITTIDGNQIPVKKFSYDGFGRIETVTAEDGTVTKYEYYTNSGDANNYGRLWKIVEDYNTIDGLNITTSFKYDRLGRIAEFNDPNGYNMKLAFNDFDKLEKIILPPPFNNTARIAYDRNGNLSRIELEKTDANQIAKFVYDRYKKLLRTIDPLNNVTLYGYNKNKDPNIVTDAEENSTKYGYNERSLVKTVTDANGFVTKYRYNVNGKLAEIEDANGSITQYEYDKFDRLNKIKYPDNTREKFTYDRNSNITSKTTRSDETIEYAYNALGWMTRKKEPLPGEPNIVFRYDIAGRLIDVNDGNSLTRYKYDRIARVIEVNDPNHRVVKYEYDKRGLRTKLTYPDDSNVTYEYDSMSRLTKVKYNGNTIAQYSYDELSRRTLLKYVNDTNAVYSYDLGDRLTRIKNNINTSPVDIQYSDYDNVGNRKNMLVNGSESEYTYDKLYQLTGVDYPASWSIPDANYYYDKLGSRKKMETGSTTEYNRNNLNQYTSVGGTAFSYDDSGNLTNDGTYKYYYDCENRLTDVNDQSDNRIASYKYDYLGRRISKTLHASQTTIHYAYDGDQIIAEYDGSNNLLRKYIYGDNIDEPICMIVVGIGGETKFYYHFDGLGSIVALSNNSGGLVEKYTYDVFGMPMIRDAYNSVLSVSSVANRFMFTGREYDLETGNYYYRARYYKPSIGRFLQTDPIGYYYSMNLYEYCWSDPVNYIDPWGLFPEKVHDEIHSGDGQLDRDIQTSPHNPISTGRHFRERRNVDRDMRKMVRDQKFKDWNAHKHEGEDTFSHKPGIGGIIEHILNPDLDKYGDVEGAKEWSDDWEKLRDLNPNMEDLEDYGEDWMDEDECPKFS